MSCSFLFLQGVSSPFFSELGKRLRGEGHRVSKVNFTGGDAFYWRAPGVTHFRRNAINLPMFYEDLFDKIDHCTDIIMFGDCRPVHSSILESARRRGKRIHVYEEGYFRPYWVTLERDGVNGASRLPRDADWYRHVGKSLPDYQNGRPFESSFGIRAWHDFQYHFWSALNPVLYPGYRTHAPCVAPVEYFGYVRRAAKVLLSGRSDREQVERLVREKVPFFLLPLQLDSDAQIRDYSNFSGMEEVIALVVRSFALFAPESSRLVIKCHPLDPGLVSYKHGIRLLEKNYSLQGRIVFLQTGHLPTLLNHTSGVVTVNSTVGGSALIHRRPTAVLANPIYNISGLTFQGPLDDFWLDGTRPDMSLLKDFRNTVIHTTQINGGFYSRSGIALAVSNSISNLTNGASPLDGLLN